MLPLLTSGVSTSEESRTPSSVWKQHSAVSYFTSGTKSSRSEVLFFLRRGGAIMRSTYSAPAKLATRKTPPTTPAIQGATFFRVVPEGFIRIIVQSNNETSLVF